MLIDPVIPLLEAIRTAEDEIQRQGKRNVLSFSADREEQIALLMVRITSLYDDLFDIVPTSSIGAGALLSLAWRWLPPQYVRHEQHMARIGARLQAGRRSIDDLVWLRALATALDDEACLDTKLRIVLDAAIHGASRPVLIFRRAILDPETKGPGLDELSDEISGSQPFWSSPFNRPSRS